MLGNGNCRSVYSSRSYDAPKTGFKQHRFGAKLSLRCLFRRNRRGPLAVRTFDVEITRFRSARCGPDCHALVRWSQANSFFTIGHSTRTIVEFADLLQESGVNLVVDVRSIPRSRTNPQFNQQGLPEALAPWQ